FVSAQSGDTNKAKKIRKLPSSPSPSSVVIPLPAISYYGRSLRLYAPAPAAIATVPYSTSTLSALKDSRNINKNGEFMGITILLLDELGAYLLRKGATRHDASSFTILETLMNHKANIRALFQSNGWILSQTTAKPEEGREVECCVLEDGCRQCVILAMKISVALIYATTVLELPNKYCKQCVF
ncbi:hypothetical protein HID58_096179, partial [Brassica napus]